MSGFVLTVLVAHHWPPATAGALFSVTSLFLILSATALLGTDTGLARFALRYEAQGRSADVPVLIRTALVPVLGLSLLLAAATVLLSRPLTTWLGLPDSAGTALTVLACVLPAAVVSDSTLAACQAFGKMRPTVLVDRLLRSGGQPVTIAAAAALGTGLTGLALAWSLPYVLAALVAPALLLGTVRRRARPSRPPTGTAQIRREFWSYTRYRAAARLCQVALQRSDIILVSVLRSPTEAAVYTAATRFVVLGQMGVQAVQQVLQPRLSQLLALDDEAALRRVFTTSTAWIMALSWPVYLTAIVAAPLYLRIFGDSYRGGGGEIVVVALGLGMLTAMAAGPVDMLLLMAGRSSLSLLNNAVTLAVNIGLNLLLIPDHGIQGAAVAWAIALTVRNLLPFVQIHRQFGLTGLSRAGALVAVSSVLCFALPVATLRLVTGPDLPATLMVLGIGAAAYGWVLWRSRTLLDLHTLVKVRRADPR